MTHPPTKSCPKSWVRCFMAQPQELWSGVCGSLMGDGPGLGPCIAILWMCEKVWGPASWDSGCMKAVLLLESCCKGLFVLFWS
jgi:hypothetical protein